MNFATPFDAVRMVSLSMEDCTPSSLVDDDDDMVVVEVFASRIVPQRLDELGVLSTSQSPLLFFVSFLTIDRYASLSLSFLKAHDNNE